MYKKNPPIHKATTITTTAITMPAIAPPDNVDDLFGYSSSSYGYCSSSSYGYYSSSSYYYSSSS